jgi:hypothetical protein
LGILGHKALKASLVFLLKAILYDFQSFTLNKLGIVYEFLLHFYVGHGFFYPTQIAHARKNTTSGHFFIATGRVVKRSINNTNVIDLFANVHGLNRKRNIQKYSDTVSVVLPLNSLKEFRFLSK